MQDKTNFGYAEVKLSDKQRLVDSVFHDVAYKYDIMNDVMSAGLHRVWKEILTTKVNFRNKKSFWHLDVAGGTGDVAFRIAKIAPPDASIVVLDINAKMLDVGQDRARERGLSEKVKFVRGNGEALPFADNQFDCFTVAFGIRNIPRIAIALNEAYRVIKPGGRFLCLEFSNVRNPRLDLIYKNYSFKLIPVIGKLITGRDKPYRYMVESARKFPKAEEFEHMIRSAGFKRTGFERIASGIVAIHSGWKC